MCNKYNVPLPKAMFKNVLDFPSGANSDDAENDDRVRTRNPNYNITFLKYLIKHVFVFGGMMNYSLFFLIGFTSNDNTNATSESWNSV
jgi:hypothetical protein